MSASETLLDEAAEVIPGGVNTCRRRSTPRLCFRRGEGAYLEDLDGRRYIDYHAAYGAIFLGHSHPAVIARVTRAIQETVLFGVGVTEAEVARADHQVSGVLQRVSRLRAAERAQQPGARRPARPALGRDAGCRDRRHARL